MVNVVLSTDQVVVLGGPEAVDIETGVGAQGSRGSLWFSGDGDPSLKNVNSDFNSIPQNLDRYIDIDPSSESYLQVFEYELIDGQSVWRKSFTLRNEPYSANEVVSFTGGQANFNVDITDLGIDSSLFEGFVNSFAYFNVQVTASNIDAELAPSGTNNPIAISVVVDDAFFDSDGIVDSQEVPLKLPITMSAAEFNGTTWSLLDGKDIIVYFSISYADPNKIISNLTGDVS